MGLIFYSMVLVLAQVFFSRVIDSTFLPSTKKTFKFQLILSMAAETVVEEPL